MATRGKKPEVDVIEKNMTLSQLRDSHAKMRKELEKIETSGYCVVCGKHKADTAFKKSNDKNYHNGTVPICNDCLHKILYRVDKDGYEHEPNQDSLIQALFYINKPYMQSLWEDAVAQEAEFLKDGKKTKNAVDIYMINIDKKQYVDLGFLDSDFFKRAKIKYVDEMDSETGSEEKSVYEQLEANKEDTVRLIGYDPFMNENLQDQPLLYSVLLGLLDNSEDANDDMMKTQSAVAIARMYLQNEKLDQALTALQSDYSNIVENSTTIKNIQESKYKINSQITKYAQESCLSLKNAKTNTRAENTWTGKVKKLKDLNLRDAELNGFDLNTCRGMRQVMDMSNKSILTALKFDESDYANMLADARDARVKADQKATSYEEICRILLRENLDLKDFLKEKNISYPKNLLDPADVYSRFSEEESGGEDDG